MDFGMSISDEDLFGPVEDSGWTEQDERILQESWEMDMEGQPVKIVVSPEVFYESVRLIDDEHGLWIKDN